MLEEKSKKHEKLVFAIYMWLNQNLFRFYYWLFIWIFIGFVIYYKEFQIKQ